MDWDGFAATAVRQVRAHHGLSQRALARLVQVPQSTISEIESGKRQPTLPLLGKIVERAGGGVVLTADVGPLPYSAAATAQEAGQRLAALADRVDLSRSLREDGALRSVIDLKDSLRRAAPNAFRTLVAVGRMGVQVVVLNGGSSSGKTSIARCLQDLLPEPWLRLEVDDLIAALPPTSTSDESVISFASNGDVVVGPEFRRLSAAWMQGLTAIARAGVGIIFHDVFLEGSVSQDRLRAQLAGLTVLWVGVHCDAEVAAAREADRPDRMPGMARSQAAVVHVGVTYDVEVDTTATASRECAQVIHDHLVSLG